MNQELQKLKNDEKESQNQEKKEKKDNQEKKSFKMPKWEPVKDVDEGDWDF